MNRYQFERRPMNKLVKHIKEKRAVTQVKEANKESAQSSVIAQDFSKFKEAFSKITGTSLSKSNTSRNTLKSAWIESPLGLLLAVGDDNALHLLEFADERRLDTIVKKLKDITKSQIEEGENESIKSIKAELKAYFEGTLEEFKTPLCLHGTQFQKATWEGLINIPYGETRSYKEQANSIGKPSAFRAVANANGANRLVIVVPCHRATASGGELGGFSCGVHRKVWLLNHEKKAKK